MVLYMKRNLSFKNAPVYVFIEVSTESYNFPTLKNCRGLAEKLLIVLLKKFAPKLDC